MILNFRGQNCPLPVINARKQIKKIVHKTIIRIECTDPLSTIDIPHMCNVDGHNIISQGLENDVFWFEIEISK